MVFPWVFGFFLGFLRCFYGFSLGFWIFPWVFKVFLWFFLGFLDVSLGF